jgi:3'-5' exoribonuclease
MGPRLPGDKGPQARPKPAASLTHNPFAALAQKIEGGEPAPGGGAPEPAPPTPGPEGAAPEPAAPEAPQAAAPETTATPGVEETPRSGEVPAEGQGQDHAH